MSHVIACPQCRLSGNATDEMVGKLVQCSGCGTSFLVQPNLSLAEDSSGDLGLEFDLEATLEQAEPKQDAQPKQDGHKPAKLKPCPDCGHIVSLTATTCPNCAAPQAASKTRQKLIYGAVGAGVSILVFIGLGIALYSNGARQVEKTNQDSTKDLAKGSNDKANQDSTKEVAKGSNDKANQDVAKGSTNKEVILTGQQIYEKAMKSTVWINNPGMGSGSGILVNAEDKLILTNYHVVSKPVFSTKEGKLLYSFNGTLTQSDPRDQDLKLPYKLYPVNLFRDKLYLIDMVSSEIDSYLQILNDKGQVLTEGCDRPENDLNARIHFVPPYDGKFQILATVATVFDNRLGKYSLKITQHSLDERSSFRSSVSLGQFSCL